MSPIEQVKSGIQQVKEEYQKIQDRQKKPDHPFWKRVGNITVFYILPVVEIAIAQFVPPEYKALAMFGYMAVSLVFKKLTKYTIDPKAK